MKRTGNGIYVINFSHRLSDATADVYRDMIEEKLRSIEPGSTIDTFNLNSNPKLTIHGIRIILKQLQCRKLALMRIKVYETNIDDDALREIVDWICADQHLAFRPFEFHFSDCKKVTIAGLREVIC